MQASGIWDYRQASGYGSDAFDIKGFSVEATDGSIGKVDQATNQAGSSYIVVDTGPWIFGKKVMLPAGVVSRVDRSDETVYVNRTKEQIKAAPEFDEESYEDEDDDYRGRIGTYYGPGGPGYSGW